MDGRRACMMMYESLLSLSVGDWYDHRPGVYSKRRAGEPAAGLPHIDNHVGNCAAFVY